MNSMELEINGNSYNVPNWLANEKFECVEEVMSHDNGVFHVVGKIVRETEKALCIDIGFGAPEWVPKSQIGYDMTQVSATRYQARNVTELVDNAFQSKSPAYFKAAKRITISNDIVTVDWGNTVESCKMGTTYNIERACDKYNVPVVKE